MSRTVRAISKRMLNTTTGWEKEARRLLLAKLNTTLKTATVPSVERKAAFHEGALYELTLLNMVSSTYPKVLSIEECGKTQPAIAVRNFLKESDFKNASNL